MSSSYLQAEGHFKEKSDWAANVKTLQLCLELAHKLFDKMVERNLKKSEANFTDQKVLIAKKIEEFWEKLIETIQLEIAIQERKKLRAA